MKKIFPFVLFSVILFTLNSYAQEFPIFEMRNKIFQESKEIVSMIDKTKNPVLITSMWDTCTIVITQIDAYFSMLGVFNSVKKEDQNKKSVDYLLNWLNEMQRTNQLNIKSLNSVRVPLDAMERVRIQRLTDIFLKLSKVIEEELTKLNLIKRSLKAGSR